MIRDHSPASFLSPPRVLYTLLPRPWWALALGIAGLAAVAATPAALTAQQGASQGPSIPAPRGMVNDFANVIRPDQAARIEALANDVRAKSGGEIAVVTLRDLGGRDVDEIALRIGREWKVGAAAKIGDATRNAGVVILVVPKETSGDGKGHVKIETGQGSEGFITDGQAGDIVREAMPLMQQQRLRRRDRAHDAARRAALRRELQLLARFRGAGCARAVAPDDASRGGFPPQLVFFIFVLLVLLLSRGRGSGCLWLALASGRGGGGWGGGGGFGSGGGGGFGGFGGGGGFSGGGSSGSW